MSNNKLNCNAEIQTLKDQLQSQQRRMAVYRDTQDLTMKNAEDMNKLIKKANQSVFCGPGSDCHKNQESERLKKIYENKIDNKKTAPEQLDNARKNYYTYAFGQPGYIEKETKILAERADRIIANKTNEHNRSLEQINLFIKSYDSAVRYKKNILLYLSKVYHENFDLSQEIKDSIASLKTADRKVWYEDDQIGTVDMWVTVLKGLYWLVFAVFVGLFLWNKMWKREKPFKYAYCVLLLLLISWLYISDYLLIKLLQLVQKLGTYLPKNVYYDAKNM